METQPEEEKPVENKPQAEASPKQAASSPVAAPAEPKKGSNVGVIVVIIVLAVIILGVGGYFGGRYLLKKYVNQTVATVTPTATVSATKTATKTATITSSASASSDYILLDSNARVISESELVGLTPWQLKVARNEIYARHGREFVHKDLQCYFAKKSWYGIDPLYSESALSTTENRNVAIILAYEEKTDSPLLQTDSGCDTNS